MHTRIFHTVNDGLYFQSPGARLLVDGLHGGRAEGCSPMPPLLVQQAETGTGIFFDLDGLFFTHFHGDHFDSNRCAQVLALSNAPRLLGADYDLSSDHFVLHHEAEDISLGDMRLQTLPCPHDGAMFAKVPHRALLLTTPDGCFFLAGDAYLDPALAAQVQALAKGRRLDGLFINPIQLQEENGRAFLRALPARRIFVCHIPFPEDDVYHYGASCKWTVKAFQEEFPSLRIPEHMQWISDLFGG